MLRIVRKCVFVLFLAVGAALVMALSASTDPLYRLQELAFPWRYHRYDEEITTAAKRNGLDPMLVKAIVWRESRFRPKEVGSAGERGLMQIMEPAAADWVAAEKIETFVPEDLFNPRTNVEVGSWYLARAMERWKGKDDPMPFALAEYNAGRTRVNRWIDETQLGKRATADDLRDTISFPGTREYVRSIMKRYDFYKARGRM